MIYNITNNTLDLSVKSFGAEICSLKKSNLSKEYIWQGDSNYWARHAPILFPIVGKVKNDTYEYNKKSYNLTQHGFARDMEFELHKKKETSLEFKLAYNEETLYKYPCKFELFIKYELIANNLNIEYKVKNIDTKPILFSLGSHIAFNCDILNEKDYFIEFDNFSKTNRYFLDNGLIDKIEPFELEDNKLALNKELFANDAIIFNDKKINKVRLSNDKDFNLTYEFDNFPYLGVWSKPTGAPFICIEPWCGIADFKDSSGIIEEKRGINFLNIEQEFKVSQRITL